MSWLLAAVALALLAALSPPLAAGDVIGFFCGDNTTTYDSKSSFGFNLQLLVASLPTKASSSPALFATAAIGEVPYAVYGLLRCRGDVNSSACQSCATAAFGDAQQLCVYRKDATVFYDNCVLRYSEENFLSSSGGSYDDGLDQNYADKRSKKNASAPAAVFDAAVGSLLNAMANLAANSSSTRYATGVVQVQQTSPVMVIFGLAQCTPNQTPEDCRQCLADVIDLGNKQCSGASSCTVNRLMCGFIYNVSPFFFGRPLVQLPAASSNRSPSSDQPASSDHSQGSVHL